MRRPALPLACSVLAGSATVLGTATATGADPVRELPSVSSAAAPASSLTLLHGRKLG